MTTTRGWTVDVTELPAPPRTQGRTRRPAAKTHFIRAVDQHRDRVIAIYATASEVAAFDPDMHWRGVLAQRAQR